MMGGLVIVYTETRKVAKRYCFTTIAAIIVDFSKVCGVLWTSAHQDANPMGIYHERVDN